MLVPFIPVTSPIMTHFLLMHPLLQLLKLVYPVQQFLQPPRLKPLQPPRLQSLRTPRLQSLQLPLHLVPALVAVEDTSVRRRSVQTMKGITSLNLSGKGMKGQYDIWSAVHTLHINI